MPHRASSAAAVSQTLFVTTPSIERPLVASAVSGPWLMRPRVAFRPTRPQAEAGIRIEPPPSVACAMGTMPAATAPADPPEEPPVECARFQGLCAGPYSFDSVVGRIPNSGTLVLPNGMRPAALNRVTVVDSTDARVGGTKREPDRVGQPATLARMSFSSIGTPAKTPLERLSLAATRAQSGSEKTMTFRLGLSASARARAASMTSDGLTFRALIKAARPRAS